MAPTTDCTVILKISQYLNIPSVQHLLSCSMLKCSHDIKFLVPLLTSFLHSQNNLAMDKVLDKMGLMLGGEEDHCSSCLGGRVTAAFLQPLLFIEGCVCQNHPLRALHQGTTGFAGVCQGECHFAENGDARTGSSDVTVAPLTPLT